MLAPSSTVTEAASLVATGIGEDPTGTCSVVEDVDIVDKLVGVLHELRITAIMVKIRNLCFIMWYLLLGIVFTSFWSKYHISMSLSV